VPEFEGVKPVSTGVSTGENLPAFIHPVKREEFLSQGLPACQFWMRQYLIKGHTPFGAAVYKKFGHPLFLLSTLELE